MAKAAKTVNPTKPVMTDNQKRAEVVAIAKAQGVKKLWENSAGEYFTTENLALLSEKGNTKAVIIHTMDEEPAPEADKTSEGEEKKEA